MRIIRSILLVLVGVFSIIMGIECYDTEIGEPYHYQTYGGDAFTGIQHTEVQTGRLVRLQTQLIRKGFTTSFIIAGLTMIACAIPTDLKKKED